MPNRSGPAPDGVTGQDFHGTVYEVIQHIPAQQQDNNSKSEPAFGGCSGGLQRLASAFLRTYV